MKSQGDRARRRALLLQMAIRSATDDERYLCIKDVCTRCREGLPTRSPVDGWQHWEFMVNRVPCPAGAIHERYYQQQLEYLVAQGITPFDMPRGIPMAVNTAKEIK